jgi:hypothetical protein
MAAFDPDAYLAKTAPKPAPAAFDPDAYLRSKTPPPPGMRAVQPGEIPTASGFLPVPQPDVPRTFMQRVLGTAAAPLDIALTLGSGAARGIAAPIYGLATGKGEAGVREVLAGVRQPQTPEAQAALEAIAPALQGLPPVIGTGAIPQLATAPVTRTAGTAAAATAEDVRRTAISREAARTRQKVAQSQQLGPKVDAAAQGREIGLAAPPQEIDLSKTTQTKARVAGEKTIADELNRANAPKWGEAARQDLGLAPGTRLDENALTTARDRPEITSAYEDVATIGVMAPDEALTRDLNAVRPGQVYGASKETAAVNNWIDSLTQELGAGADSRTLLRSIRQMRDEANSLFKSEKAGQRIEPVDMAMARAKIGAADALEELIARNVQDRTVLYRFQDARKKLAQTYDYERALDFATGEIDPQALAKLASAGKPLSGNLEKMANFAANFPEVSTVAGPGLRASALARAGRGTVGGTVGGALGGLLTAGSPLGVAAGVALGGIAGERLSTLTARGMASPATQAALANVPDYRLPVNRLTPVEPSVNRMLPTLYDWRNATAPNWVPGRGGPEPTFGVPPAPTTPLLGLSTAEETMANVQRMREGEYMSDMLRAQAAERAAQEAAQSPYGTSRGEIILDLDPITGRLREASQGIKGATPDTFQNFGANLASGAQKVSEGKLFDMTLAEKVAWERTKVDLAEAAPGLSKLTDAQIAEKMMDRAWVADTVKKAREKAAAFDEIARRADDAQAARNAAIKRDQLLNTLEALEEQLRAPRPVELGGQGPKTRAAKAEANPGRVNMLAPEPPAPVNRLIVPENVGSGPRPQPGPVEVTAGPSIASRRPPEPPAPPPPAAPPTPPTPAAPAAGGELVDLYARIHKGSKLKAGHLNDIEWLKRELDRAEQIRGNYIRTGKFPTQEEGGVNAINNLIMELDERIAQLSRASVTPGEEALEAALKRTFGYTPSQVKQHFSSRDKIERGIFQIEQQLNLDRQLQHAKAKRIGPEGLEELLAALKARLKEVK